MNGINRLPPENLVKVWPYIEWLDQAVYRASWSQPLIPGPVFQRLVPDQKILAHGLCYTMDKQTPYRRVWEIAGPIMAELVEEYSTSRQSPLDRLAGFCPESALSGHLPRFKAKTQVAIEKLLFTPRFPETLFSIAVTLAVLNHFCRSLTKYLLWHCDFLACDASVIAPRIAFLFDLLSYYEMPKQSLSAYPDIPTESNLLRSPSFCDAVIGQSERIMLLLKSGSGLEAKFQEWIGNRFHKRLWAAIRDYLKEGREFHEYFRSALRQNGLRNLSHRVTQEQSAVLTGLEVPGDVWNLLFFQRVFTSDKNVQPKQFRSWFDHVRMMGQLPQNAAVERLDVSFRYSPRMCDERREESCIFRRHARIWDYCPPRNDVDWKGKPCPVTDHLCGIHYACEPTGCPVKQGSPSTDLCQGCRIKITEGVG